MLLLLLKMILLMNLKLPMKFYCSIKYVQFAVMSIHGLS